MSLYDTGNQIKASWVKWGKVGNKIAGTLISIREMESRLPEKRGQMMKIYEILADDGEFNDIVDKKPVDEVTKINPGEIWLVGGGLGLDNSMRNIKVGQIIGIKYTEERPNSDKLKNPTKVKKVFTEGKMNDVWLKEKEESKNSFAGSGF